MNGIERSQIDTVRAEVAAVSAKVDILLERDRTRQEFEKDHEARVRLLERWRYALPVSTVLSMGTMAVAAVALFLKLG